eukprot:TRINITY_DN233_c0_g2_i1.p1 TRINITY_DN233_c0_g2~~TRINITY_DN233_c0_g2_i1.p1  ORF type:complete len:237 (+),score=45.07 TRINITY_DN233_c0_g2_i1:157-867(+)
MAKTFEEKDYVSEYERLFSSLVVEEKEIDLEDVQSILESMTKKQKLQNSFKLYYLPIKSNKHEVIDLLVQDRDIDINAGKYHFSSFPYPLFHQALKKKKNIEILTSLVRHPDMEFVLKKNIKKFPHIKRSKEKNFMELTVMLRCPVEIIYLILEHENFDPIANQLDLVKAINLSARNQNDVYNALVDYILENNINEATRAVMSNLVDNKHIEHINNLIQDQRYDVNLLVSHEVCST